MDFGGGGWLVLENQLDQMTDLSILITYVKIRWNSRSQNEL